LGFRCWVGFERSLHPERASGAALTGEAVADVDHERIALDLPAELSAMAGGHRVAIADNLAAESQTGAVWGLA
jgi:hypothetical protein